MRLLVFLGVSSERLGAPRFSGLFRTRLLTQGKVGGGSETRITDSRLRRAPAHVGVAFWKEVAAFVPRKDRCSKESARTSWYCRNRRAIADRRSLAVCASKKVAGQVHDDLARSPTAAFARSAGLWVKGGWQSKVLAVIRSRLARGPACGSSACSRASSGECDGLEPMRLVSGKGPRRGKASSDHLESFAVTCGCRRGGLGGSGELQSARAYARRCTGVTEESLICNTSGLRQEGVRGSDLRQGRGRNTPVGRSALTASTQKVRRLFSRTGPTEAAESS